MKYIDTHCHLTKKYFDKEQREEQIKLAKEHGVTHILIPGTDPKDSLEIQKYKNKNVLVAAGVHPADVTENCLSFFKTIDFSLLSAIGEIGIDLYWENNPPLEIQIKYFELQLHIALEHNLPVIIHCRDANKETYNILSKDDYKDLKIIMHSYTGNLEWANKFLSLGAFISFSGIVTFKNAKEVQEVAKNIPLNKILCETDSPYLTPAPHRGLKPNVPKHVKHVVDFIAELRNEENDIVKTTIYNNSLKIFNIK